MSLAFTFVDLITVIVIVVSAIYAIYRGFVSETLSIVAWAAAAFASLYFGPWVVPLLKGMIASPLIAYITGYALVFVAVVIPISFASARFSEGIKKSPVGPLDQSLGFAFGVVRGLAIVGIAYLMFTMLVPVKNQPETVRDARLLPLIRSSAQVLLALVPNQDLRDVRIGHGAAPAETTETNTAKVPVPQPKPTLTARDTHKRGQKAYGAGDRRALDRLIEATGNGESGKP
jgi:membrane protein required for colicin V production